MITLYVKSNCPFSAKAIRALKENGVPYEEKNIADPEVALELLEKGGKRQVPFMDDHDPCAAAEHHAPCLIDGDVEMYESDDIVKYVQTNYGKEEAGERQETEVTSNAGGQKTGWLRFLGL
jgi:glutaredoxin